jgi:hypothetical protein
MKHKTSLSLEGVRNRPVLMRLWLKSGIGVISQICLQTLNIIFAFVSNVNSCLGSPLMILKMKSMTLKF